MRHLLNAVAIACLAAPLVAQVATPARPVTDPKSLVSPATAAVRPVPLDDIGMTRSLTRAAWSADGRQIFVATNLTGRTNIWRTDVGGSWPLQITQSDERQKGVVASADGRWVLYEQDVGGNEYDDVYRVPVNGGPVENVTRTPNRGESYLLVAPTGGLIALSTKLKSEGQSNLAVMTVNGVVRALTHEADPQYSWQAIKWVDGGRAIIANRIQVDQRVAEVWRIEVAHGRATRLLGKADTEFWAADASDDGSTIAVTTNDGTGQRRADIYNVAARSWSGLRATPWEQHANLLSRDGRSLIVRTNVDSRSTLYRVDLATMVESPIALPPGVNRVAGGQPLSPDGRTLMVTHSAANSPTNLYLLDLTSGAARPATQLAMASLTPDLLPTSSLVTYKSFDGTLISAVVTMPPNLRRDGSHPAVVIPHGGPTSQAQDDFSQNAAALASRSYIVIQPNFRGSTGYGAAFQAANHKDLGGGDLKDTIAAKQFLVASGYVDSKRVGIFGSSYGGFMALMAIGRAPDEFAAAVQYFGIINWRSLYRDQDEWLKAYLRLLIGTPEADPAVYDAASPLTYIRNAKAPLLTIQGENDIRVPRGQAQEVHDILKAKGNIVETVFYPAEGHGFQKRENQLDSLRRMIAWFDRFLKPTR